MTFLIRIGSSFKNGAITATKSLAPSGQDDIKSVDPKEYLDHKYLLNLVHGEQKCGFNLLLHFSFHSCLHLQNG